MSVATVARNQDLMAIRNLLQEQQVRKIDVVAPAPRLRMSGGQLKLSGIEPMLTVDGVTDPNGMYQPTEIFDEGLADKLGIPISYLRKIRANRPDLYDLNVNGWLRGKHRQFAGKLEAVYPADDRSFLVRGFRGDDGEPGIARAFLSDRYAVMDNLDALMAALDGIRQAGVDVQIDGCDLSDRRMYVRIKSEEVALLAPELLKGYISPFGGASGTENPTVFAGLVISNSETGNGAFSIVPRLIVEVCNNGLVIQKDAMRAIHLGGRMDDGIIKWGEDTERKNMELVTVKARDAVRTFLDVDYMKKVVNDVTEKSARKIEDVENVKVVAKKLQFDQEQTDLIFNYFVDGGVRTAGGVMHAITAAARSTTDPDKSHDMESLAIKGLDLAAAL